MERPQPSNDPKNREKALACGGLLWDYLRLGAPAGRADAILVLGSSDVRSAEWGARLWLEGRGGLLILSGGRGRLTHDWEWPEAELFARAAEQVGVPRDRMLLESCSSNTGENIRFTRQLVESRRLALRRWILVHTPYMERRTRATARHYWPGIEFSVSSLPVSLEGYPTPDIPLDGLLHRLAGEVHRILEYPDRGWQAPDHVPQDVLTAWKELVALGYDGSLVSPEEVRSSSRPSAET